MTRPISKAILKRGKTETVERASTAVGSGESRYQLTSEESDPSGGDDLPEDQSAGSDSGSPGRPDAGTDESATEPAGDGSETVELPLDCVFEILKNSRRRRTLHYLEDNGGETTLSDLAEHVAAIENDVPVRAVTSTQRKRVYVGLYQCHLPKMADMNVIEYDKARGTIELTPAANQVYRYIDGSESRGWSGTCAGLGTLGIGLVAASALGFVP